MNIERRLWKANNYDEVSNNLLQYGYKLLVKKEDYMGTTINPLVCIDDNNYMYVVNYTEILKGVKPKQVHKSNPYSIYNISIFLKTYNLSFTITSDEYLGKKGLLSFKCNRCGENVESTWDRINRETIRNGIKTRGRLYCPYCDGSTESQHALVLKQVFMHEYPDTILEDKSCINPTTLKIMPTDIVNHRLKIAIEIQSEYHDNRKDKDLIKKQYWINRGYQFYDPDIRQYDVLEMCQLFFKIDNIPNYVNFNFSNKIPIKKIQEMLDEGLIVPEIAKALNINSHRIYDGLHYGKLHRRDDYTNPCQTPVVQLDLDENFIAEYPSINAAQRATGVPSGNISSTLLDGRNYANGYYWCYKEDYKNNKQILKTKISNNRRDYRQ